MNIDTYIIGIKDADDEFKKMKKVYDACKEADVRIPDEVIEYFDDCEPDENDGLRMDLDDIVKKEKGECKDIWVLKVSDIPNNIKYIKFINSY